MGGSFWTGARRKRGGQWKWSDNSKWNFSQNKMDGGECAVINKDRWEASSCSDKHHFVCKKATRKYVWKIKVVIPSLAVPMIIDR